MIGIFLFVAALIEGGIVLIEIALVAENLLRDAKAVAEALIMHDLTLTKEAKGILDVGIVDKPQEVVVGKACLLLGGEVFVNISKNVARYREHFG